MSRQCPAATASWGSSTGAKIMTINLIHAIIMGLLLTVLHVIFPGPGWKPCGPVPAQSYAGQTWQPSGNRHIAVGAGIAALRAVPHYIEHCLWWGIAGSGYWSRTSAWRPGQNLAIDWPPSACNVRSPLWKAGGRGAVLCPYVSWHCVPGVDSLPG